MFDPSFSDSDHTNTCEQSQESETSNQLAVESQNILLKEQNAHLMKENSALRAQFEQALSITKQVDEVHQKNRQLKTTLRDYQSTIDNLKQRVEISSNTIEELNQKLADEKANSNTTRQQDQKVCQKEIQKIKDETQEQMDNIYSQIDKLKKLNDQKDLEQKMLRNKVDRCMENAQHFFQTRFQVFDDFITFLSQTQTFSQPEPQNEQHCNCQQEHIIPSPPIPLDMGEQQIQKLTKRLKRAHLRTKDQQSKYEELEGVIIKMKKDQQDVMNKHQQEINALKKEFEQKEEDMYLQDADQKHTISQLNSKIDAMKNEIAKRKASNEQIQAELQKAQHALLQQQNVQRIEVPQEPVTKKNTNDEFDAAIEHLTKKNTDLSNELKSSISQQQRLTAKIHELEASNNEKATASEKLANEMKALKLVHNETVLELESMRRSLHEKDDDLDSKTKCKVKRQIHSLKSQVSSLESTVESQRKQAYELSLENEQAKRTINQLNDKLHETNEANDEYQRKIESLKDELYSTQQLLDNKKTLTIDDILPPSAFKSSEFESKLSEEITRIAINPSLQPSSKIQNIYKAIKSYYNQLLATQNHSLEEAYGEIQKYKNALSQLLINSSIALGIDPISLESFFSNNGYNTMVSSINQVRGLCNDYKRSADQLNSALQHIYKVFSVAPDSDLNAIIEQADKIKEQLNGNAVLLQKRGKKYSELNFLFKTLQRKYDNDVDELNSKILILNDSIQQLSSSNDEISKANQQYKREIQSLKNEYRDFKEKKEEYEAALTEKLEEDQAAWNNEKEKLEAHIKKLISNNQSNLSGATQQLNEKDLVIDRLKKTINVQKTTITERDHQLKLLKQQSEESLNNAIAKYDQEKKQLISSYEKAVEEITKQCDAHRSDVEKLSEVLASTEKKLKQSKAKIMQVKRDNINVTAELQSQIEQNERDKQLAESTTRSAILNAETSFNTRVNELKSKYETDKRRTYSYVADSFKQFFNPHENINEKSFKIIVNRAKDELTRLVNSDSAIRRLVCAASHQNTDDAVAQALMSTRS